MADFVFGDGTEANFDLSKITMKQWRDMRSPAFSDEDTDLLLGEIAGVDAKKLASLSAKEYKKFFTQLVKKMMSPLDDPN